MKRGEGGRATGLSSSTYKGAFTCVIPVGGDDDVEDEDVADESESLSARLRLATRVSGESGVCNLVDPASSFTFMGTVNREVSSPSGDSGAFFDWSVDWSASGYALTWPLARAASNARMASACVGKL